MAKDEEKSKSKAADDTVPGFAGPVSSAVVGLPPGAKVDKQEGDIVDEALNVMRAPEVHTSPLQKTHSSEKKFYAGMCFLEGDTHKGFHYKVLADLPALTEEGAFNTFKGHFPDGVREGFSVTSASKEDIEKFEKEAREGKETKK